MYLTSVSKLIYMISVVNNLFHLFGIGWDRGIGLGRRGEVSMVQLLQCEISPNSLHSGVASNSPPSPHVTVLSPKRAYPGVHVTVKASPTAIVATSGVTFPSAIVGLSHSVDFIFHYSEIQSVLNLGAGLRCTACSE